MKYKHKSFAGSLAVVVALLVCPQITMALSTDLEDLGYLNSPNGGAAAGSAVTNIGDINGDSYTDLAIGAPGYSGDRGAIYILYGRSKQYKHIDLDNQARLVGEAENDRIGYSIAGGGDLNDDGYADFIFGTIYEDTAAKNAGAMYIMYGQADKLSGEIDISSYPKYLGSDTKDRFGEALAIPGDLNGDGFDDIIAGGQRFGNSRSGETFVIYGQTATLSGDEITNSANKFSGEENFDQAGSAVAGAGDVNGDGLADFIIGAPGSDTADDNAGATYIIYGQASTYGNVSLANADVTILGDTANDASGSVLASAGDVNGDTYNDFLIGSPYSSYGASESGVVYLVYGRASLSDSNVGAHVPFYGKKADDYTGLSISGDGDVNADGFDDFIIGAPAGSGSRHGLAVVVYGQSDHLTGGDIREHDMYAGEKRKDEAGISVAMLDIDADRTAEIAIGAHNYSVDEDDAGRAYIGYIPVITCDNSAELGGIMADYPQAEWKHRNYQANENLRIVVEKKGTSAYLINCKTDEVLQEMRFNNRVQRKILARVFTKRGKSMFVAVTRNPNKRKIKIYLYKQKKTELVQTDYLKRSWRPRGLRINVNSYRRQIRLYKGAENKHLVVYWVNRQNQLENITGN